MLVQESWCGAAEIAVHVATRCQGSATSAGIDSTGINLSTITGDIGSAGVILGAGDANDGAPDSHSAR